MPPPSFFADIQRDAARRWDQLEQDPDLAGPWHQLFKQVQSPRHVLSELLQNADDAGATEATVRIDENDFVFEHNGEDFAEEHFRSLCRFGYSNKRALHTIGFRGIGFKSTFSLGDHVDLTTPSLAVRFHRRRFTEPHWHKEREGVAGRTRICVPIEDANRRREIEKNLEEWSVSAIALLFFKNIRRIQIGELSLHWGSMGPGPVPNSEWMGLHGLEDQAYLHVSSDPEAFPPEALEEIRQERMLGTDADTTFPPCSVEVVLGAPGRLFVVLPTGVETGLPFACNAPFIQDPARLKIKDPEISPTNRWLLARAGRLAAGAMLQWLAAADTAPVERARAYGFLLAAPREESSLEITCHTIVAEEFAAAISGKPILLTDSGTLVPSGQSVAMAGELFDVWPEESSLSQLDSRGRPPLSRHIGGHDLRRLVSLRLADRIDGDALVAILQKIRMPRPQTWRQLLTLWILLAPRLTSYLHRSMARSVRIVPVQGMDDLHAANEVVRLGEKKLLQSDADWDFLATRLLVLNQNWTRFLAEERRTAEAKDGEAIDSVYQLLELIGLDDTSDAAKVIDQVAADLFAAESVPLADCIQLAQIAAKLGVVIKESFRYVTADLKVRPIRGALFCDEDGTLEEFLSPQRREMQLLHADYMASFGSCSREDWLKWLSSGASGLSTFVPLTKKTNSIYGRSAIERTARQRGTQTNLTYHYVTPHFYLEDWDFEPEDWKHWELLAAHEERFWAKLVARIFDQRPNYWSSATSARAYHVATTGNARSMTSDPILPSWALRFRDLPCLEDTRGFRRKPGELLRRTPETEPFMDVEPFVNGLMDRESTRPLLDLLGVQRVPANPGRILDRLRALAGTETPPLQEVDKWYRRLDQLVMTCSTADLLEIREAFRSEKLILAQDGTWTNSTSVFVISSEEDVPGAAVVRASVADLAFWQKIAVAERPTADLAIAWLQSLPSGAPVTQEDMRRVRSLLGRYPVRIWEECGHWLSLSGNWMPVGNLSLGLSMQSLTAWRDLHPWVKQQTADLQPLRAEIANAPPFARLLPLASRLEGRLERTQLQANAPERKEWLLTVGTGLRRVDLGEEEETARVRALADRLARTIWVSTPALETIPYLDGTPAGTPRKADLIWLEETLYVGPLPRARLARRVPEQLAEIFGRPDIKAALDYSFERPAADIREYFAENFSLADVPDRVMENERRDSQREAMEAPEGPNAVDLPPSTDSGAPPPGGPGSSGTAVGAEPNSEDVVDVQPPGTTERPPRPAPKPPTPALIERFALSRGYLRDGDDRFRHADGHWIGRMPATPFPWELHDPAGEVVRRYLPVDHCFQAEPIEIDAAVWGLLEQRPSVYALILIGLEGPPVEVTGTALLGMRSIGKITLYPSTYRLVHDNVRQHQK